ncbi:MAG TPA: hypothetical protein VG146_10400 [Verrucomicrobiae bacterium]|nr:hypothetical protein [Verrucomicrobiae bacterium]
MVLLPPVVVGPLSECSSRVKVQGQLIGVTVDIYSNGAHVATGTATWTDQTFPLLPGKTLAPGAAVAATQTIGGTTSPKSSSPVTVQKKPPVIGTVAAKTHIYVCGQCLWLEGMVPGAKVEVSVGGVLRGSGIADDGSARFGLSVQTGAGDILVARQTACGTAGTPTNLPKPDALPGNQKQLMRPVVVGPLRACQRAVTVKDVVDGAQVVLTEAPTAGFTETACFDLSELWFPTPPLKLGDQVTALQQMPRCEIKSAASAPVVVGPSTPVPVPTVVPPLCAGGVTVRLTDLLPGSPVEILQNGVSLGLGSAPASTFDFGTPALAANAMITARQELCTNWSAPSAGVNVDPHPASLPTPVVGSPLYECGAAVHVSNLHPGATVYVFSTLLGAPIGSSVVYTTQADVPVAPLLIKGDHIFAEQKGCGLVSSKSAAVPVQPTPKLGPPVVQPPVETCMRSVTVGNVVPGAHVDLYINGGWRGSAIATATTVEIPILFGPLHVGDAVKARQMICNMIAGPGEPVIVISSAGFYYVTQHFDAARTGWNPFETTLTVANVPALKVKFTHNIDGTAYAQPLYAHHVNVPGFGAHNLVFIATENDTVYAFDADTNQPALWKRSLIPAGEQIVAVGDIEGCDNVAPVIGITSTPVIDCTSYTMWVVAKTKKVAGGNATFHYRLYALDISTGTDRVPPVEISGSVAGAGQPNDGHGHVVFDPHFHLNRPGLLLLASPAGAAHNRIVFVGFGSHCDFHIGTYHGWVFAYDSVTLARIGVFATTPDTAAGAPSAAGVWQGGMGLAADPQGFVYFTSGNGDFTGNTGGQDYGDTVIKVTPALGVADYFTPSDQPTLLAHDIDLGSGGVLILPDPPPSAGLPSTLVAAGKDGNILLINRNNMGKYTPGGPDKLVQVPPVQMKPGAAITDQSGVWGGPAFYRNSQQQQFVYYCGSGGHLKAYLFSGIALALAMIGGSPNQSPQAFPSEGGVTPNVSSNHQNAGTGVVWAITRSNPLRLQAFDATNLTHQLLDMNCGPWNNPNGGAFTEPTAIQGKVYVPSDGKLTVFGL